MGWVYFFKKQLDQAIAEFEKAIALDPNYAFAYAGLGQVLACAGRPEEALRVIERAVRHDPYHPMILHVLGFANRLAGRDEEGIEAYEKSRALYPYDWTIHLSLTVAYKWLGREAEARAEAAEVMRLNPNFSLEAWGQRFPYKDQAMAERDLAALRKAGLK